MEAQHPEPPKRGRQKSGALSKLPIELLYQIISNLDTASILSLRSTCYLALYWVFPSFCKLLKSRKYFLHPYSFNLLEELSLSPFAECVERIVIGTETFQPTFHLTANEYGRTLTSTLQRFINLRAVEIRDTVPVSSQGYYDEDIFSSKDSVYYGNLWIDRYRSYYIQGHRHPNYYIDGQYITITPWGEEEDHLHSQGFRRVSAGYSTLAFRKPPTRRYFRHLARPDASTQLGELFTALLHACTVAKTAGVNVTDFRVALMCRWGIPGKDLAGYSGHDRSRFLSSLEVLHLATAGCRPGRGTATNIGPFTSACTSLKWIRVVFGPGINTYRDSQNFVTYFSQMGERSPLNRLELAGAAVDRPALTSLILNSRPKILTLWEVTIGEPRPRGAPRTNTDDDDDSNWGWGKLLRAVTGVVGHVRLVDSNQLDTTERWIVRLNQRVGVETLPDVGHGYIHLSPDSVEEVVRVLYAD